MNMDELRGRVAGWLADAGFTVSKLEPLPSHALWGLLAASPPPVSIKLHVLGLSGDRIILGIGIAFSKPHLDALNRLEPHERLKLTAALLRAAVQTCPTCRVGLHGAPSSPRGLIVEQLLDGERATRQLVVDTATRLTNVFIMINSVLWERFPEIHAASSSTPQGGYM